MKISVSLPDDDVRFLDAYARQHGVDSRSAVIRKALHLLCTSALRTDYELAWQEWDATGDAAFWEPTAGDGLPAT